MAKQNETPNSMIRSNVSIHILFICILIFFKFHPKLGPNLNNETKAISICFQPNHYTIYQFMTGDRKRNKFQGIKWALTNLSFVSNSKNPCPKCNFTPSTKIHDSTERDGIFIFSYPRIKNVHFLVNTIRTTGCQALVIHFVDNNGYQAMLSDPFQDQLKSCKCFTINYGKISFRNKRLIKQFLLRWMLVDIFLDLYSDYFDRICTCDPTDSIFQGDPFGPHLKEDRIYGYKQLVTYFDSPNDFKWLLHPEYTQVLPIASLNPGFTISYTQYFRKFVKFFIKEAYNLPTFDQGNYAYFFFSGLFEKNGIHIVLDNIYHIAQPIGNEGNIPGNLETTFENEDHSQNRTKIIYMHHYYQCIQIANSFHSVCPRYYMNDRNFDEESLKIALKNLSLNDLV